MFASEIYDAVDEQDLEENRRNARPIRPPRRNERHPNARPILPEPVPGETDPAWQIPGHQPPREPAAQWWGPPQINGEHIQDFPWEEEYTTTTRRPHFPGGLPYVFILDESENSLAFILFFCFWCFLSCLQNLDPETNTSTTTRSK